MKKLFSIILTVFCIFSFNLCFQTNYVFAETETTQEFAQETVSEQGDDVLDEPIFQPENNKKKESKFGGKLSSIVIKIIGGVLLLLVIVICGAFIWLANLQRRCAKKRKKQSVNENVINAVDNFARHRIK